MLFVENKKDLTKIFDLKQYQSVTFLNCNNCTFSIPNKINKIFITNCNNVNFNLNNAISSLEITQCSNLILLIYGMLMTTQLDFVKNTKLHYYYSKGFVISSVTDQVLVSTPVNQEILPYHMFLQQYITNLETFRIKHREECVDREGYLLLE